jgi:hypothetical protein
MISEEQEVSTRSKQTELEQGLFRDWLRRRRRLNELEQILESDLPRLSVKLKRLGATCRSTLTVRRVNERRCSWIGYHSGGGTSGGR